MIVLLAIVSLGACLRFLNYPLRYGFDIDATRDAILTQYAAAHHLLPMVGPISALGTFNFGPWYYYQLIVFQSLVSLAYAPWVYVSLTSLIVIIIMYGIGNELFDKKAGLILALLTAVSPGQVIAGTGLSNPDLVSLFAAVSLWLFIRLLKGKSRQWMALLFGLAIGIGINCHYQMVYFVLLPILLFIFCKKNRFKILFLSFLGIFLSFVPLLYFDLTHHWHTVSGVLDYYLFGKNKIYVPNRWLTYVFNFWPSFWGYVFGFPATAGFVMMSISVLFSVLLVIRRKVSFSYVLLFFFFIACFIFLRFFSGERASYYLIFFHPFLILLTGVLLWYFLKIRFGKIILGVLLLVLVIGGVNVDLVHTHPVDSHVQSADQEKFLENYYPNKQFSVFACEGQYRNQVQAMVFLLSQRNKLGNDVKIGFRDLHCRFPVDIVDDKKLDTIGMVNLSVYSVETLKSYGWTLISPQYLYTTLLNY
jgi:hypothetical protein